jgi:hypothetical protein
LHWSSLLESAIFFKVIRPKGSFFFFLGLSTRDLLNVVRHATQMPPRAYVALASLRAVALQVRLALRDGPTTCKLGTARNVARAARSLIQTNRDQCGHE